VTSSPLDLELLVDTRQAQLLTEAATQHQSLMLPRGSHNWRRQLAARLYALAAWLSEGATDARRGWKPNFAQAQASADRRDEVEYWCAFPPPLAH
jgi:hypothetical protein